MWPKSKHFLRNHFLSFLPLIYLSLVSVLPEQMLSLQLRASFGSVLATTFPSLLLLQSGGMTRRRGCWLPSPKSGVLSVGFTIDFLWLKSQAWGCGAGQLPKGKLRLLSGGRKQCKAAPVPECTVASVACSLSSYGIDSRHQQHNN